MRIKVLDERCKPEQHGDWCDLKMYQLDRFFVNMDDDGNQWTPDSVNEFYEEDETRRGHVSYCTGDVFKVSLGVAMEIPEGYHAQVVPRSSTRNHYGVMLTNHIGIIDNSYCGDNDIWMAEFYAIQDGEMRTGDRVLQFRLVKNGDPIEFEYVETLGNADRGGFGSTGR